MNVWTILVLTMESALIEKYPTDTTANVLQDTGVKTASCIKKVKYSL